MSPASAPSDAGAYFETEHDEWCKVSIDTRGRSLEPSASFLRAWNLVASRGQPGFGSGPIPHSEDEAREQICGDPRCELEQPRVIRTSAAGKIGIGVLIPERDELLAVAVAGGGSDECREPASLDVEVVGELMHVRTTVTDGHHVSYDFHGDLGEFGETYAYGSEVAFGGCEVSSSTRTDLIIDISTAELELTLTQVRPIGMVSDEVDVELHEDGVRLRGCHRVLELAWTDPDPG
ncbi:hypothetical protein ENSA5_01410 [Enhygromyxa salina]|uniref:Uncharacterized protein n=1 Tax=Enhygromyxa salina TaxID=215803 RepID=A0A2S9YL32_9BACT|nr:hypothetical protein [Enhygromyxa salina]PRQ05821.1 hypothetical protein ENSA5_01410 [Enhygromyxa salina]